MNITYTKCSLVLLSLCLLQQVNASSTCLINPADASIDHKLLSAVCTVASIGIASYKEGKSAYDLMQYACKSKNTTDKHAIKPTYVAHIFVEEQDLDSQEKAVLTASIAAVHKACLAKNYTGDIVLSMNVDTQSRARVVKRNGMNYIEINPDLFPPVEELEQNHVAYTTCFYHELNHIINNDTSDVKTIAISCLGSAMAGLSTYALCRAIASGESLSQVLMSNAAKLLCAKAIGFASSGVFYAYARHCEQRADDQMPDQPEVLLFSLWDTVESYKRYGKETVDKHYEEKLKNSFYIPEEIAKKLAPIGTSLAFAYYDPMHPTPLSRIKKIMDRIEKLELNDYAKMVLGMIKKDMLESNIII